MDDSAIRNLLDTILAPWVRELHLAPQSSTEDSITLRLPHADHLRHAGGVICGQVFMAAADTAMVVAISHAMGGFVPMTTVSLNTTFMRPVKSGDVLVTAKIQRRGRNLVFGEIELRGDDGELAAHATTTYALINPTHQQKA
ncbi:PaaI family thioesterase [Caballeronia sp. LP006]|uniref:PaaI family thioesterase n=1 Tax=unclassified Caballeronia TaxID=2646786 RepID=UPI002028F97A|nr:MULTISPECIES: PaaI family thioesterase [unclassified Caballeronia]MDR5803390.1 PaaI family thioesterase [Caballeronia sp. LZ001]MDR5829942.1 PaaI family thioesterase [Caballeronia sp. LP006]